MDFDKETALAVIVKELPEDIQLLMFNIINTSMLMDLETIVKDM